jgi:hypothetical protein
MEESKEMKFFDQIEKCLLQEFPVESLRNLVIYLNNNGISKEELLKEFYEFDQVLIESGRAHEQDCLEDVLDMMTGFYGGYNINFV